MIASQSSPARWQQVGCVPRQYLSLTMDIGEHLVAVSARGIAPVLASLSCADVVWGKVPSVARFLKTSLASESPFTLDLSTGNRTSMTAPGCFSSP